MRSNDKEGQDRCVKYVLRWNRHLIRTKYGQKSYGGGFTGKYMVRDAFK